MVGGRFFFLEDLPGVPVVIAVGIDASASGSPDVLWK
jgi:hypothetical protein